MAKPIYRGFSSVNTTLTRSIVKTNIEIIEADLLNHFYTRPGEDRMDPLFGCRLREKIMEQYGSSDRTDIINEVMNVVQADPRVTYISTTITDSTYGISIAVQLLNIATQTVETIIANFNLEADALYGFSGS